MKTTLHLSIIGCGDFLRWQLPALQAATHVKIVHCFDPVKERAEHYACILGAEAVDSDDAIWASEQVDAVALFVPPWVRLQGFKRAHEAGKSVITTKPLSPTVEECEAMVELVSKGLKAAVIYNRTESAFVEALKDVLQQGTFGKLALVKQDWIHHYPTWNKWALDPERNGGPFMDAMIHNLNITRYLMGRKVTRSTLFSEKLSHPELSCSDTEFMKLDFEDNGLAHLFITWAADLAVYSDNGNDREHIDQWFAVTDQGWMIRQVQTAEGPTIQLSKDGRQVEVACPALKESHYDLFANYVRAGIPLPERLVSVEEAAIDIQIIRASKQLA